MSKIFRLESELVETFTTLYMKSRYEVMVKELPIRFGNIDVVSIKNPHLPLSDTQIEVLSKPACALVFTKIKNERPISKHTLVNSLGLSKSTAEHTIYDLLNVDLIAKDSNNHFTRKSKFVFPKTIVTGYEAKLTDFNKAFYQAKGNKDYVDYSYLIFPLDICERIFERKKNLLQENGIGLIGVSKNKTYIFLKATKLEKMKNHVRLLNLAKANKMINSFVLE